MYALLVIKSYRDKGSMDFFEINVEKISNFR